MTEQEAITTEIPKVMPLSEMAVHVVEPVQEHRPFDAGKFLLVVDKGGIRQVCTACHRLTPDCSLDLGKHIEWAERHWIGAHT